MFVVNVIIIIVQLMFLFFIGLVIREIIKGYWEMEYSLIISLLVMLVLVLCYPLYMLNQKCPECNTTRAASDYCTECGYDFGSKKIMCKSCSERQSSKNKFCQKCGNELITNETE